MINTLSRTHLQQNRKTYQRLKAALKLNLRRQVFIGVCDNFVLRDRLSAQLQDDLIYRNPSPTSGLAVSPTLPRLVSLYLDVQNPDPLAGVVQWLTQHKQVRRHPAFTMPAFQLLGVEQLSRQPAAIQWLFLNYLQGLERSLPALDSSLLIWLPRPWARIIPHSAPDFWRCRTAVFEFEGEPTPLTFTITPEPSYSGSHTGEWSDRFQITNAAAVDPSQYEPSNDPGDEDDIDALDPDLDITTDDSMGDDAQINDETQIAAELGTGAGIILDRAAVDNPDPENASSAEVDSGANGDRIPAESETVIDSQEEDADPETRVLDPSPDPVSNPEPEPEPEPSPSESGSSTVQEPATYVFEDTATQVFDPSAAVELDSQDNQTEIHVNPPTQAWEPVTTVAEGLADHVGESDDTLPGDDATTDATAHPSEPGLTTTDERDRAAAAAAFEQSFGEAIADDSSLTAHPDPVENPNVERPDLNVPDVDLSDVDLPDVDLPDVDLPDVDLSDVDLPNVDLSDVDLPVVGTAASFSYAAEDEPVTAVTMDDRADNMDDATLLDGYDELESDLAARDESPLISQPAPPAEDQPSPDAIVEGATEATNTGAIASTLTSEPDPDVESVSALEPEPASALGPHPAAESAEPAAPRPSPIPTYAPQPQDGDHSPAPSPLAKFLTDDGEGTLTSQSNPSGPLSDDTTLITPDELAPDELLLGDELDPTTDISNLVKDLEDPGLEDPGLDSPGLEDPGLDSPGLDGPDLEDSRETSVTETADLDLASPLVTDPLATDPLVTDVFQGGNDEVEVEDSGLPLVDLDNPWTNTPIADPVSDALEVEDAEPATDQAVPQEWVEELDIADASDAFLVPDLVATSGQASDAAPAYPASAPTAATEEDAQPQQGFSFDASDPQVQPLVQHIMLLQQQRSPKEHIAEAFRNLGNLYRDRIEQGDLSSQNLVCAMQAYRQVLRGIDESHAMWPEVLNDMGNLCWLLSRGAPTPEQGLPHLQQAIVSYQMALSPISPESHGQTYPMIQNNLGAAYGDLARYQEPGQNLQFSIHAYQEALLYRSFERDPARYASTQNNLGTTYWNLAQHDAPVENLKSATRAYSEALRFYRPDSDPLNYGMVQNNLGTTYWNLAQHEQSGDWLRLAIKAYETALRYRTVETNPATFAATQNNLGTAYWHLATYVEENPNDKATALEQAIQAYDAAIAAVEMMRQQQQPLPLNFDIFATHNNLGLVQYQLSTESDIQELERPDLPNYLNDAIDHHLAALQGWHGRSELYQTALSCIIQTLQAIYTKNGLIGQNLALSKIPGRLLPEIMPKL